MFPFVAAAGKQESCQQEYKKLFHMLFISGSKKIIPPDRCHRSGGTGRVKFGLRQFLPDQPGVYNAF
jgi:hypothetical protein